jgi:hypothetical protein
MLFKLKDKRLYITYKDKEYPVRMLTVRDAYRGENTFLIAPERLDMDFDNKGSFDAQVLDAQIHFFIPDRHISAEGSYIVENCLDFKYELVREEFGIIIDEDTRVW